MDSFFCISSIFIYGSWNGKLILLYLVWHMGWWGQDLCSTRSSVLSKALFMFWTDVSCCFEQWIHKQILANLYRKLNWCILFVQHNNIWKNFMKFKKHWIFINDLEEFDDKFVHFLMVWFSFFVSVDFEMFILSVR